MQTVHDPFGGVFPIVIDACENRAGIAKASNRLNDFAGGAIATPCQIRIDADHIQRASYVRTQSREKLILEIGRISLDCSEQILRHHRVENFIGEKVRVAPIADDQPIDGAYFGTDGVARFGEMSRVRAEHPRIAPFISIKSTLLIL